MSTHAKNKKVREVDICETPHPITEPQTVSEAVEARQRIENEMLQNTWRTTCCGNSSECDKTLLAFGLQALLSVMVLAFCIVQLFRQADPANSAIYYSILSSTLTLHAPAPGQRTTAT